MGSNLKKIESVLSKFTEFVGLDYTDKGVISQAIVYISSLVLLRKKVDKEVAKYYAGLTLLWGCFHFFSY